MTTRVSLAELAAADIRLRPSEAVAIVSEICRRVQRAELHGVPPTGVIKLTRDGELIVEGPMTTGDDVVRAACLLNELVPSGDAAPEYRASGGLRLAIARALGTLDLPPYGSLAEFCAALSRFSGERIEETARGLFHAWERAAATAQLHAPAAAPLTISDIRRARRATGLSLNDLAAVAEVPARQLRDLEWGDLRNWRADADGRSQVIRYARAAGLDEGLVLSIAWPMIVEAAPAPGAVTALVPSGARTMAFVPRHAPAPRHRGRYARWAGIAAAAVLIAAIAVLWLARTAPEVRSARADVVRLGVAAPEPAPEPAPAPAPASSTAAVTVARSRPAVSQHTAPPVRRVAALAPRKRRAERKPNAFERELFRIVFK